MRGLLFLVLLATVGLAVCSTAGASKVTGTVTYLQRIALSPDAVITVTLQDVAGRTPPPP